MRACALPRPLQSRAYSAICELAISRGHLTLVTLSNLGPVLSEFSVVLSLLPRMLTGDGLSVYLAGAAFGAGRCGLGRSESKPVIKDPRRVRGGAGGGQPRTSPVPPRRGRTRTGASPPSQGRGRPPACARVWRPRASARDRRGLGAEEQASLAGVYAARAVPGRCAHRAPRGNPGHRLPWTGFQLPKEAAPRVIIRVAGRDQLLQPAGRTGRHRGGPDREPPLAQILPPYPRSARSGSAPAARSCSGGTAAAASVAAGPGSARLGTPPRPASPRACHHRRAPARTRRTWPDRPLAWPAAEGAPSRV
jgi:hypothetical protein